MVVEEEEEEEDARMERVRRARTRVLKKTSSKQRVGFRVWYGRECSELDIFKATRRNNEIPAFVLFIALNSHTYILSGGGRGAGSRQRHTQTHAQGFRV